jgi:protoporphyrinogen oxidase
MFENYIKFRYGKTLYNIFFKPYTEKFLKWPITDIHSDWASTGINRTVIDSRIKSESLIAVLKNSLLPNKIETEFLYPKEKGFGHFFDVLYQLSLKTNRCKFIFNSEIKNIVKQDSFLKLQIESENFSASKGLVWTGNLNDLLGLINSNPKIGSTSSPKLNYLNTIFYNFIFKTEQVLHKQAQWLYVSDGNFLICRITCMREFSKTTTPEGFYNFIVEVTDSQSQPVHFQNAETLSIKIIEELKRMKFISSVAQPMVTKIIPIRDTYPIYSMNYKEIFNSAHKQVKEFSNNIHLIGRSGAFWYNNSDHSIRMAIEFVNRQIKNDQKDFDHRNYFGGSH